MKNTHSLVLLAVLALAGCGDDESPEGGGPEGGAPPVGGAGGGPTVDLEKPDAGIDNCHADFLEDGVCRPSLSKCAPGTIPDIDAGCVAVGVPNCAPEFVDERGICLPHSDDCEEGSYPVPSLGCVSIDGDEGCGLGKWGNIVEQAGDVHIDASYLGADSDGSRDKPYIGILDSLEAPFAISRFVLAEGSYQLTGIIEQPFTVEGVCASKVTISPSDAPGILLFSLPNGESASLKGLTLSGAGYPVTVDSGHLDIDRVRIRDTSLGVWATDTGEVSIRRTLIQDIDDTESVGYGVFANESASLEIRESAIIHARTAAIGHYNGGTIDARDLFAEDTLPDPGGYSLAVSNTGGVTTIDGSVFIGSDWGPNIYGDGQLTMMNSVVAETTDPDFGDLFSVNEVGTGDVSHCVLADGAASGLTQYGGKLASRSNWVTDLTGGTYAGAGLVVQPGSDETVVERDVYTNVKTGGIQLADNATASGLVIENVAFDAANGLGVGALVVNPKLVRLDRSFISGVVQTGVFVPALEGGVGAVHIEKTRIEKITGEGGAMGMGIVHGGHDRLLELIGVEIADVSGAGVLVTDSMASIRDLHVLGVKKSLVSRADAPAPDVVGPVSYGLLFHGGEEGSNVAIVDSWLEGYEDVGIVLSTMSHTIRATRATGGKVGLATQDGASAEVEDCDFAGNSDLEQGADLGLSTPP